MLLQSAGNSVFRCHACWRARMGGGRVGQNARCDDGRGARLEVTPTNRFFLSTLNHQQYVLADIPPRDFSQLPLACFRLAQDLLPADAFPCPVLKDRSGTSGVPPSHYTLQQTHRVLCSALCALLLTGARARRARAPCSPLARACVCTTAMVKSYTLSTLMPACQPPPAGFRSDSQTSDSLPLPSTS